MMARRNGDGRGSDAEGPRDEAHARDDAHGSGEARPSKSARKRDALAAQRLGEELVELKDRELDRLELPERLADAIRDARDIRSRGAAARQRQYIGRLMRDVDVEKLRGILDAHRDEARRAAAARLGTGARSQAPARPRAPQSSGAALPAEAAGPARRYNESMQALVGIIMGSQSDWETMAGAAETLEKLGVPYEVRIVSAHRTPDLLFEYASSAHERGLRVLIAGAGGAAHLPGMTAAKTTLPVLGVPVPSRALAGLDSLLSIVQMPAGVPVATFAIGTAGAVNAALCAAAILAGSHPAIDAALRAHREQQRDAVLRNPDPRAASRT